MGMLWRYLKDIFPPEPLVNAERFRFHRRHQEEGESVPMFAAALKKLSEQCELNGVLNDIIRDRLECGLRSEDTPKRLLTESHLTLVKDIEITVSMELAAEEAQPVEFIRNLVGSSNNPNHQLIHYNLMKQGSPST